MSTSGEEAAFSCFVVAAECGKALNRAEVSMILAVCGVDDPRSRERLYRQVQGQVHTSTEESIRLRVQAEALEKVKRVYESVVQGLLMEDGQKYAID